MPAETGYVFSFLLFVIQLLAHACHQRIGDVVIVIHDLVDVAVGRQFDDPVSDGLNEFVVVA